MISAGGRSACLRVPSTQGTLTSTGGSAAASIETTRTDGLSGQRQRLPYADLLRRYDRPGTLFYLDPPYWSNEADYGPASFRRTDFGALATQLASLQGRFTLSINELPEVRDVFAVLPLEAVTTDYSINSKTGRRTRKLIITRGGGSDLA